MADTSQYPAGIPPAGVTPNFVDPKNHGQVLIVVSSLLLGLMILFVTIRLYSKLMLGSGLKWDDATCFLGAAFTIFYYGITVFAVNNCHVGIHQYDLTLGQFLSTDYIINSYLAAIIAPLTLLFIKTTFFILYFQLFSPQPGMKIALWIGTIFTVIFYVGNFIASVYLATPRKGKTWLEHFQSPTQARLADLGSELPGVGLAIDLYILALPIAGIWRLQMQMRRKIGVILIFTTGILAVVASTLSLVYRITIVKNPFADLTYNLMPVYLTSNVEMTLGVCVTCMPAFSHLTRSTIPAYATLRSAISSRFSRSRSNQSDQSNDYSQKDIHRDGFVQFSGSNDVVITGYELQGRKKSINTYINGANLVPVEEDGIYLKHELRQESHSSQVGLRNSETARGTEMV